MVKNTANKAKTLSKAEIKKAPSEKHIPTGNGIGNFCGAGTLYHLRRSGKYEAALKDAGRKLVGKAPYGRPVNRLDSACQAHDRVYAKKNATGADVRNADKRLAKAATAIARAKGGNKKEKAMAVAVAGGMGVKIAVESTGVIRKGSLASGGEKESKLKRGVKAIARAVQGKKRPTPIMKMFSKRKGLTGMAGGGAPPLPQGQY